MTFYAFVLPGAIYMTVMIILPILSNVIMSFQDVNLMNFASGDTHFVGLAMYKDIFQDKVMWTAIWNTLWFTLWCLIFQFPIGFAMAMFFSKDFKGSRFLRGINVIAWMIPMITDSFDPDRIFCRLPAWLNVMVTLLPSPALSSLFNSNSASFVTMEFRNSSK